MEKPKRTYKNAGTQSAQGRREGRLLYWDAPDSDLFTVKGISLVLGIRLQMVKQIPVQRIMIDKRGYYRKGDIRAWMEADLARPDSLLKKLQAEHAKTVARMSKQPSRRYQAGMLGKDEAKQARELSKANKDTPPMDAYEARIIEHLNWVSWLRRKK